MKFFQESTFEVVKEEGKVICTIDCKVEHFVNGHSSYFETFSVKSCARCHPDDTFDELVGKHLAETRASEKACKRLFSNLINHYKEIIDVERALQMEIDQINSIFEKVTNHLKILHDENN